MAESFESLQIELANLMRLVAEAREHGNHALADLLAEDAARHLIELADFHTPAEPIRQQRQVSATGSGAADPEVSAGGSGSVGEGR